jgi:HD-like signal output (HDOD) protein
VDKLASITPGDEGNRVRSAANLQLECPPLPHTLFEAMAILDHPDSANHDRVLRMVQNDPLVVVRLLRIVNSPYYAFSRDIESADRAVRLLGPLEVARTVMGMNVARLQNILDGPAAATLDRLILHGVATSRLGQWLWDQVSPGSGAHEACTAGLLHDFGKIVLLYSYPVLAVEVYEGQEPMEESAWLAAESVAFGCNHLEAGELIVDKLDFPPGLKSVIKRQESGDSPLKVVTAAADVAARALGFHFEQPMTWESCCTNPVWDDLAMAFPAKAGDKSRVLTRVRAQADDVARFAFQLLSKKPGKNRAASRSGSRSAGRQDPAAA